MVKTKQQLSRHLSGFGGFSHHSIGKSAGREGQGTVTLICLAAAGINAISANLMSLIGDLFPQKVLARVGALTGVGDGAMSMSMMLLTGVIIDRFSYTPVFFGAALLPVLTFMSLLLLVGRIRPISLAEITQRSGGR